MPLTLSGTNGVSGVDGTASTPANRGSDTNTGIVYGTDTVQIATGGTTAVTVDSSQNVGVGVTPSTWSLGKAIEINTVGNSVWATSTAYVMGNNFYYNGGYKFAGTGYATSYIQSTGAHVWNTSTASGTAGNAITFTPAMTLDSSGNLLVGNSSSPSTDVNHILASGSTSNRGAVILQRQTASTSGVAGSIKAYNGSNIIVSYDMYADGANNSGGLQVYTWNAGASAAGPYVSKGGTSWTSSSDIQLKDIDGELENALEKVKTIRSVYFTFKDDEAKTKRAGFIAQEIQNVLPEVVNTDRNGFLGVEYQTVTVLLSAAIKELSAKLDAAEARIAALEAK